jgi:hypothetical protein
MAKQYPKETCEEVLHEAREGQRVSEVAKAYGINGKRCASDFCKKSLVVAGRAQSWHSQVAP